MIKNDAGEIPLIVSNKHVLCGKAWIEFDFASMDGTGQRLFGPSTRIRIAAGQLPIFEHADTNVDLAAMPLNPLVERLKYGGKKPHALLLGKENLAPPKIEVMLHASTTVLMVGFPNGIMDEANNLPVVRRGTLATHYKADYQGQSNFVVDIASFGGSSGSPVFALFEHLLPDGQGNISLLTEPQIYLLGVLHSGPMMTTRGEIVPVPVPTSFFAIQTNLMIHLGYCAKASRIEEISGAIKTYISEGV